MSRTLSLAERRAVKAYQDEKLPALHAALNEAAGTDLALEVHWEAIARPDYPAESYADDDFWTNVFFTPLAAALRSVGQDDMGKEAIKAGIKTVVITYDEATAPVSAYENGLNLAGGTLTLNFQPYTNTGDENSYYFKDRVAAIVKFIESKL
jgi:hypothetical protein